MWPAPAAPWRPRGRPSPPDGYTVFFHHIGFSTAPSLYRKLPYDTISDFEPIGMVSDVAMTLVARKDFPAKDLRN